MESFKEFSNYIQNYHCPICQESVDKKWKIITPCNHIFHKKCYKNSISNCPICRKNTFNLDNSAYIHKLVKQNYLLNMQISKYKVQESMNLYENSRKNNMLFIILCCIFVFLYILYTIF